MKNIIMNDIIKGLSVCSLSIVAYAMMFLSIFVYEQIFIADKLSKDFPLISIVFIVSILLIWGTIRLSGFGNKVVLYFFITILFILLFMQVTPYLYLY